MGNAINSTQGRANQAAITAAQDHLVEVAKTDPGNKVAIAQATANVYGAQGNQDNYLGTKTKASDEQASIGDLLGKAGVDPAVTQFVASVAAVSLSGNETLDNTNVATAGRLILGADGGADNSSKAAKTGEVAKHPLVSDTRTDSSQSGS